jgi:putative sigma-54 modulation protein
LEIEITARSGGIPDKAKDYVREKLAKVGRLFDRVGRVQVSLERGKDENKAHVVVSLDTGSTLVAETRHEELRAAIDLLTEKVERQVRREKERLIGRNRKGAPAEPSTIEPEAEPSYEDVIREQLDKD